MSNYLNLNLTEGDDNLDLSDLFSIGTESVSNKSAQHGGFFWSMDGNNGADQIALKAAQLRNYYVIDFLVNQNLIRNYGSQDSDGCTLLHYLARETSNEVEPIVDKVLARSNIKSFINIQNKDGDTPLHVAVKAGNHDIAEKLVGAGSDKSRANKEGMTIMSVSESETAPVQNAPQLVAEANQQASVGSETIRMTEMSEEEVSKAIQAVVDTFMRQSQSKEAITEGSLMLPENLNEGSGAQKAAALSMIGGAEEDTEAFIQNLISKYNQSGGGNATEAVVEEAFGTSQCGGARFGRRRIPMYHEGGEERVEARELSRLIDDQSRANHEKAVEMIIEKLGLDKNKDEDQRTARRLKGALFKEVLRENREISSPLDLAAKLLEKVDGIKKTDIKKMVEGLDAHEEAVKMIVEKLKVDDSVARNIKAVMWKKLREENPTVGNLELSVMLAEKAKKAKKGDLEKIDPSEGEKIRDESRKRRDERKATRGPRKHSKKQETSEDMSATSDEAPEMVGEPSETSFSE